MSRIDDDIDARRQASLRETERRNAELRKEQRQADVGVGRFAATLAGAAHQDATKKLPEPPEQPPPEPAKKEGKAQKGARREAPRTEATPPREGAGRRETLAADAREGAVAGEQAPLDGAEGEARQARGGDEAQGDRRAGTRGEEKADGKGARRADPHERVGKAKEKGEREGGSSGGKGKEGGFKIPPSILMQAPPVRQPVAAQTAQGRGLAQSLIEKIVERVRVGTNRAGLPEFQIDMKADILGGVMIRLTCKKGRVRAAFRGGKSVLAQIAEAEQELRAALEKRGLTLEDVELEEA